jgi:hypothetical protein
VLDYTLALKRTLEPQRHEISTELRYNRGDTDNLNEFSLRALPGVQDGPLTDRERREIDARTDEYTLQGDYTRSFGERTKLETGYKGTMRQLDNDFDAFAADQGENWAVDSGRSNAFQFDERVNAVYGVLSHGIGKVDLQGGLRLEGAATDFQLDGTGESFDNRYTSLFPSGVLSYNLSDARQVKLSRRDAPHHQRGRLHRRARGHLRHLPEPGHRRLLGHGRQRLGEGGEEAERLRQLQPVRW